jgi:hypothetical protein
MELLKNFEIEGGVESLKKCMLLISKLLEKGWVRDKEAEKESLKRHAGGADKVFCIICSRTKNYPSSKIYLLKYSGKITTTNIYPVKERRPLSNEEFNYIVRDFYEGFVKKAVEKTGVSITFSGGNVTPEDLLGRKPAKLLKLFSNAANKSSGSSHPLDRERWFNFIISAHLNGSKASTSELGQCLLEDGWSDEMAHKLVCQYEYAKDLLQSYDNMKIKRKR